MQKRKSLKRKSSKREIIRKQRSHFRKRSFRHKVNFNNYITIVLEDNYHNIREFKVVDKDTKNLYGVYVELYRIKTNKNIPTQEFWTIEKPKLMQNIPYLSKLLNITITITNGKDTISGKVLNASYVGGGSTNPPVPGLPPNDEH